MHGDPSANRRAALSNHESEAATSTRRVMRNSGDTAAHVKNHQLQLGQSSEALANSDNPIFVCSHGILFIFLSTPDLALSLLTPFFFLFLRC